MSLDFTGYYSSEITDPIRDDPCYRDPLPIQLTHTPSPELFDQECDNDDEVSKFHCSTDELDTFFNSSHDTNPAISTRISTLSAFTDSTDSSYGIASSQYSFDFPSSESDYLNPSESEFENHWSVKSEPQAFISPTEFTDPLPYIPPLDPAEAHGTMDLKPNFLADDYSTAIQQPKSRLFTHVDPAALSAHVISDEAQMASIKTLLDSHMERPFKCPYCPYSFARQHNLRTHIETHDRVPVGYPSILADDYSTAMQSTAMQRVESVSHFNHAAHSVPVIPDAEAQIAPVKKSLEKPFKCPHPGCPFASARRHNLKTHAGTHDRDASKRFVCDTCDSRFSRKHDLHRHREALHTDRTSSSPSYASSASGRRFDLRLSQYRITTVSGDRDGRPMPSLHPGSFSDTGFEDLTARFEHATRLQGA